MNKKLLAIVLIVALAGLALINYQKRIEVSAELKKLSLKMEQLQGGGNTEDMEQAKQIIALVGKHMVIQGDIEPTVAKIVDAKALQSKNDFYKLAKNGDYLIVTPTRAILYDPAKDMILDVAPVQLEPVKPSTPVSSSAPAMKK